MGYAGDGVVGHAGEGVERRPVFADLRTGSEIEAVSISCGPRIISKTLAAVPEENADAVCGPCFQLAVSSTVSFSAAWS